MEWGASRIVALRKHAGMTQAQFAQWLGVSTKQVKYLEHQRRNPGGPTRRLLDILAAQFHFNGTELVQVLGTDITRASPDNHRDRTQSVVLAQQRDGRENAVKLPMVIPQPVNETKDVEGTRHPTVSADGAFVWR